MKRIMLSILLMALALIGCKSGDNSTTGGAQPQITGVTPNQLNPGAENIEGRIFGNNFSGVTSVDLGSGIVVHNYSTLSATEIYIFVSVTRDASPGPRTVSVVAANGVGSSSNTFTVGDNRLPVAKFTVTPPVGYKSTTFRFDASPSFDPDGNISNYQWRFGDGQKANGKIVNHQFNPGGFEVQLTVSDNRGSTHEVSRFMKVDPSRPPQAAFSVSPETGDTNTVFEFDATRSHDPDGRIVGYVWSFGDGGTASGAMVSHKFTAASNYSVFLSVSDNTGGNANSGRTLQVGQGPTEPPPTEPPPPSGDGEECSGTARNNGLVFGTVVGVDGFDAIVQFAPGTSCGDVNYICGDMRRANPERFRGIISKVTDLGNGTFAIRNDCPFEWPPDVGEDVFLIWKTCADNHCQ